VSAGGCCAAVVAVGFRVREVALAAPVTAVEGGLDSSDDQYLGEHHVYTPHRAGLPPLGRYVRELWKRRQFVVELARAELKAQNWDTVFGQVWLVLNPLFNAGVYLLLRVVLSNAPLKHGYLVHLIGGIFVYTYVTSVISQATGSVVGGGRLIMNTAFPRLLLPVTQIVIAFFRFLPTLPVLALLILLTLRGDVGWPIVLAVPVFILMTLTAAGLGFISAALQVYFRDWRQLLPYLLRLMLYLSPVLYFPSEASHAIRRILRVNPLAGMFDAWSTCIVRSEVPGWHVWAESLFWSLGFFLVGSLMFMSRERDFAVRI